MQRRPWKVETRSLRYLDRPEIVLRERWLAGRRERSRLPTPLRCVSRGVYADKAPRRLIQGCLQDFYRVYRSIVNCAEPYHHPCIVGRECGDVLPHRTKLHDEGISTAMGYLRADIV